VIYKVGGIVVGYQRFRGPCCFHF